MRRSPISIRLIALAGAAVLLVSACGDNATKSSTAHTTFPTTNKPAPALTELSGLLDDDGVLTVVAAQRLFAAYVAPLPGIEPLTLSTPAPDDIAGMALRRLTAGAPGVTPEIRAGVEGALATHGGDTIDIAPGGPGKSRRADAPSVDELRAKLIAIRDRIQTLTGTTLSNPLRVRIVTDRATRGDAVTDVIGEPSRSAPCRITIPRGMIDGTTYSDVESSTSTLAHEMWHCFQLSASPASWSTDPAWIVEGQAEYAGEAYVNGSPSAQGAWDTWLTTPPSALFRRSYDAIGIYALAAARGVNTWQAMLPMLGRGSVRALEGLFGVDSATIMRANAQALVRDPSFGAAWETTGPGVTGARASAAITITSTAPAEAITGVARYAGLPIEIAHDEGDILVVQVVGGVGGAVAFPGAGTIDVAPGTAARFCMRNEPCVCPDGTNPGGGAPLARITGNRGVGAVGATAAGDVGIRGQIVSLDAACRRLVGEWETDVSQVVAGIGAVFGSMPLSCNGPYRLGFRADGTFTLTYRANCRGPEAYVTAQGVGNFSGTYSATDTAVDLAALSGTGELTINGRLVDRNFLRPSAGRGQYMIAGDQLTWGWPIPDRGPVTFTLRRVG